jgi:hypothetical protein
LVVETLSISITSLSEFRDATASGVSRAIARAQSERSRATHAMRYRHSWWALSHGSTGASRSAALSARPAR